MDITGKLKRRFFGAELAKLEIKRELKFGQQVLMQSIFPKAKPAPLFNPQEIQLSKKTAWSRTNQNDSDTGEASFVGGEPATFKVDLFFDSYEGEPESLGSVAAQAKAAALGTLKGYASFSGLYGFLEPDAVDVRQYTREIEALTLIDPKLGRPPICELWWGSFNLIFRGYLIDLSQTFTLFMPDGMPVRAKLDCTFEEYLPKIDAQKAKPGSSALDDDPTRIVQRGETLSSIANEEYNDPSLWRAIARANGINNPRQLTPGQVLIIPVLR